LRRKFLVRGVYQTLQKLENDIRAFNKPEIHACINCASRSCPRIPPTPLSADNLEEIMEARTRKFLNEDGGVLWDGESAYIFPSSIFKWFAADFAVAGGALKFIKNYWEGEEMPDNVEMKFQPYDWGINSTKNGPGFEALPPKKFRTKKKGTKENNNDEKQNERKDVEDRKGKKKTVA